MDLYYIEADLYLYALISNHYEVAEDNVFANVTFVKFLEVCLLTFFSVMPKGESCLVDAGHLSFQ